MKTKEIRKVKPSKAKTKKAVLYTRRFSSMLKSQEDLLKHQEDKLRAYCKKEKIKVVKVYRDDGESGLNFDRPGFQKFFDDLKKEKIKADYFLFTKIDRFAVNLDQLYKMHHTLVNLGITPKCIDKVDFVHIAVIQVQDLMKDYKEEDGSKKIKRKK